jgi:hypothetical protein
MARKGSNVVYNTIPKYREWLTINCVMNVAKGVLLRFYIFKGEELQDDDIKFSKLGTCMLMQKKTWMTTFLFKKFLSFFRRLVQGEMSFTNQHLLVLNGMATMLP